MEVNIETGRKISVQKLFDILQQEYIICLIREKIYPYDHLKAKWMDTASKKKDKIEDIAAMNDLPSIFNDGRVFDAYVDMLINNVCIPKFYYTSNENRERLKYWDLFNWFCPNAEVNCQGFTGTIFSADIDKKTCLIAVDGKKDLLEDYFENIKRIGVNL